MCGFVESKDGGDSNDADDEREEKDSIVQYNELKQCCVCKGKPVGLNFSDDYCSGKHGICAGSDCMDVYKKVGNKCPKCIIDKTLKS